MVETAKTNSPSWAESRAITTSQRESLSALELERDTAIFLDVSSASMALAAIIGKVALVKVMMDTAYVLDALADYPNLAGKVILISPQFPVVSSWCAVLCMRYLHTTPEKTRFPVCFFKSYESRTEL